MSLAGPTCESEDAGKASVEDPIASGFEHRTVSSRLLVYITLVIRLIGNAKGIRPVDGLCAFSVAGALNRPVPGREVSVGNLNLERVVWRVLFERLAVLAQDD